jgi:hypothetical protein
MSHHFKKIKCDGFSVTLEYSVVNKVKNTEGEESAVTNDFVATIRNRPHPDFVNALAELRQHVVMLCELGDYGSLDTIDDKLLNSIEVTGISIGGSDEHEGVTIIAKRKLKHNKILNLITPFTKWEDEHMPYQYESDLSVCCSQIIDEARQYLVFGKYAPDAQMKMEF